MGERITSVPISTRLVRAAMAAIIGKMAERYPSSVKWCSDSQTESNPSSSAATAKANSSA